MAVVDEFRPILSDRTERAKRNLLVVSVLVLGMFWFGKLPTKIPLVEIPIDTASDQSRLLIALIAVTAYMLINFVCAAGTDLRVWVDPIWKKQDEPADTSLFGISYEQLESAFRRNDSDRFFTTFIVGNISMVIVLPFVLGVLAIGFCLARVVL